MTRLTPVTRVAPCEVCGRDHKCSRGSDGLIMCGRQNGPVAGFVYMGQAKGDDQFAQYRREGDPLLDETGSHPRNSTNGHTPHKPRPAIDWAAKVEAFAEELTPGRRRELAESLGLPEATITLVRVGFCPDDPHGPCWTIPECDAHGQPVGYTRRYRDGSKKAAPGCGRGLILPDGWADRDGPILLPEGASDTLALLAMGLSAIGRPGNTGGVAQLAKLLKDVPAARRIIVLAEYDPKPDGSWPGRYGAVKVATELTEQLGRPFEWALPPDGAKDVRAWVLSKNPDVTCSDEWHDLRDQFVQAVLASSNKAKVDDSESANVLAIVSCADLLSRHPDRRPPVIEGLLRRGETMNLIAAPKVGKSWLTLGLAFSVATGESWLNTFATAQGNVLLIDNELHPETSAHRLRVLAHALGIPHEQIADTVSIVNLRGQLQDLNRLGSGLRGIESGRFRLVIIDAFYRTLPKGTDENDNAMMAALYNSLDYYADKIGAAFVLIHHASKGNQAAKAVTDVGAGAGAQARATDTHLILRPHEEEGCVVVDAAVRSWAPISPLCLRWNFPYWEPAPELDPTALLNPNHSQRRRDERDRARSEDQARRDQADDDAVVRWVDDLAAKGEAPASCTRCRTLAKLSGDRMVRATERLIAAGILERAPALVKCGSGNRSVEGLRRLQDSS